MPEGQGLGQLGGRLGHVSSLPRQILGDGAPQRRVGDVVGRVGRDRAVAAGELVLALRAGLDPREPMRDRVVDRLVVAELEVQERVVLDAAPVAAVEAWCRRRS